MKLGRVVVSALAMLTACTGGAPRAPSTAVNRDPLIAARVRRLSNVEFERTVHALVGGDDRIAERLPPDVRQNGYTVNAEQEVPAAWGARVASIARDVAHRAVEQRLETIAPCATTSDPHCPSDAIGHLGRRAFRRPLTPAESTELARVFDEGSAQGRGARGGIELVLVALLESPSLLYTTELGGGNRREPVVSLTAYETASALSYMLRGAPPDERLLQSAADGTLASASEREAQARRLLAMADTRDHFRRFILEWLEVDQLELTAKSAQLFPEYDDLKSHMLAETTAFADEVMVYGGGTVRNLLDAGFASVDPPMARLYGLQTWGARASLAKSSRGGLLQQASFLAAHAHEDATSPVKRGDFVMRKLLCRPVPRPAELGIEIKMPPASAARSTRERFSAHIADASCASCHATLDAIGYTFEGFDGIGRARTAENGKPIDTSARMQLLGGEHTFASSLELTRWLAADPAVSECFARQAFRYFSAGGGARVEDAFLELRRALPRNARDDLFEALVAYARSDLFVLRRTVDL